MAWYFHRTTTMSLPANVLVIPLAGILMPAAVLAVSLSYVSFWLAHVAGARRRVRAGGADWNHPPDRSFPHLGRAPRIGPNAIALAAATAFGMAMILARRRLLLAWVGVAGLLASAAWIVLLPSKMQWHPGVLEITAIDVGQGDSLLVITPEGKSLLLDSGGVGGGSHSDFDVGEEVVSPYLWSRGIRRLDAVAISHPHSDHIGGMRSVIANFRPKEFWYGLDSPAPEFSDSGDRARGHSGWPSSRTRRAMRSSLAARRFAF